MEPSENDPGAGIVGALGAYVRGLDSAVGQIGDPPSADDLIELTRLRMHRARVNSFLNALTDTEDAVLVLAATGHLDEASSIAELSGDWSARGAVAQALFSQGEGDRALSLVRPLAKQTRGMERDGWGCAETLVALGQTREAERFAQAVVRRAERQGDVEWLPWCEAARALAGADMWEAACEMTAKTIEIFHDSMRDAEDQRVEASLEYMVWMLRGLTAPGIGLKGLEALFEKAMCIEYPGRRLRVLAIIADEFIDAGDEVRAGEVMQDALSALSQADAADWTFDDTLRIVVDVLFRLDDAERFSLLLDLVRAQEEEHVRGSCLVDCAGRLLEAGSTDLALELLREGVVCIKNDPCYFTSSGLATAARLLAESGGEGTAEEALAVARLLPMDDDQGYEQDVCPRGRTLAAVSRALLETGRPQQAEEVLAEALETTWRWAADASLFPLLQDAAETLAKAGRDEEAAVVAKRALECVEPAGSCPFSDIRLSHLHRIAGDEHQAVRVVDEALAEARKSREEDPPGRTSASVLAPLVPLLCKMGEKPRALQIAWEALEAAQSTALLPGGDWIQVMDAFAAVEHTVGESLAAHAALADTGATVEVSGSDVRLLARAGVALARAGEAPAFRKIVAEIEGAELPEFLSLLVVSHLAEGYLALQDKAAVDGVLDWGLEMARTQTGPLSWGLVTLAEMLARVGRGAEAVEFVDHPGVEAGTLAWLSPALAKGGRTDQALRALRRAIVEADGTPDLRWVLCVVCQVLVAIGRGELILPLIEAAGQVPMVPSPGPV